MAIAFDPILREYNRMYHACDQVYHRVAQRSGVSDSGLMILYFLCEMGGPCRPSELCAAMLSSKQTVHSALRILKQKGALELSPMPGHSVLVRLTEAGEALAERIIAPLVAQENAAIGELSPEERQEFLRLNGKYCAALRRFTGVDCADGAEEN